MKNKPDLFTDEKRYFLVYSTANESDYAVDYANILAMTLLHPGVSKIHIFIAVSEVFPKRTKDEVGLSLIGDLVNQCEWLELHQVIFKTNVGRDFSSAQICLQAISSLASDQDEVLVRNRSAYGPFKTNWFRDYSDLFNSQEKIGLVGNTINQSGHPKCTYSESEYLVHVQTYLYLSSFKILKDLVPEFPGVNETDRLALINKGELVLSREILDRGFCLSCLYWPGILFGLGLDSKEELSKGDVKKKKLGLPFEHRKSKISYPEKRDKWKWWLILRGGRLSRLIKK